MTARSQMGPGGITALSIFYLAGALISSTAGVSLLFPNSIFPNSIIEPMWRVNPRGHQGLIRIGLWGVAPYYSLLRFLVRPELSDSGRARAGVIEWQSPL